MRGERDTSAILHDISAATDVDVVFMQQELEESCKNMKFVFSDVPNIIKALRNQGILCVIATDNMDTFRQFTIKHMNLADIFDDFLLSNELGVLKFDKNQKNEGIPFFDEFLAKHGFRYSDAVLVDDCIDDGTYAQKGLRTLHATSPEVFREHLNWLRE